mmetsp:Transcript_36424/g.74772  ORF Transcript_36424/g.74772 Transcript_36424/m.74772 type:complete len:212 (+) Transcript_36424:131-766(+)|eukprot:CAMPEP_0181310712 /NCGR_PEP_ID=MMETSP1101-20121128/12736_1 /TAXON_ID=46948 /ORGANISM="Rhodomonas abbreviata, Strain Caron Lab Isolate" /LENGTH=211 /DNA_ID=CAMNT_0023417367 /DNA_START=131 /DNA_END=766 /DNA_ORIENTATION=+
MSEKAEESDRVTDSMDDSEEEGGIGTMLINIYYALMNMAITLGAVGILMVAFWLFKWANCTDCCCNSCNRGSSYCAFPRFNGEDLGDETRNYIFWMCIVGFLNFALSYSIWANHGSPRIFLLTPGISALLWLIYSGLQMKWLLCRPVQKPQNNLANWISMDALDTEHGRVALFTLACYTALLCFDACICFVCCCCVEEMEEDEEPLKEKED